MSHNHETDGNNQAELEQQVPTGSSTKGISPKPPKPPKSTLTATQELAKFDAELKLLAERRSILVNLKKDEERAVDTQRKMIVGEFIQKYEKDTWDSVVARLTRPQDRAVFAQNPPPTLPASEAHAAP